MSGYIWEVESQRLTSPEVGTVPPMNVCLDLANVYNNLELIIVVCDDKLKKEASIINYINK